MLTSEYKLDTLLKLERCVRINIKKLQLTALNNMLMDLKQSFYNIRTHFCYMHRHEASCVELASKKTFFSELPRPPSHTRLSPSVSALKQCSGSVESVRKFAYAQRQVSPLARASVRVAIQSNQAHSSEVMHNRQTCLLSDIPPEANCHVRCMLNSSGICAYATIM